MALSGTLQTLSLAEIFQTLDRSQATGVLRLVSLEGARDIAFIDGAIVDVVNRNPESAVSLGQRIAAAGIITDDSTNQELGSATGGYAVIDSLREKGLEENVINEVISGQLLDELYDIFTWEQANFEFIEIAGGDELVSQIIENAQKMDVKINTNQVLMESARRLDEWNRSRHQIQNDHVIFSQVAGREDEFMALASNYPDRIIVPYVNGINSVSDIMQQSVATRLDIYLKLVEYLNDGLVLILSTEQIVASAESFEAQNAYEQAAILYRRALANSPDNSRIRESLAQALEKQGEGPEAAGCFAELALGYLREGDTDAACNAGAKAVSNDGGFYERNAYIQCLESAGRIDEATEQMRRLAEFHVDQHQWIEAKEVCHQILSIVPDDELSMHVISLSFNHTCDLDLQEYEVACVHCGQVNNRNNINCENCSARLHKLCRNCHSEAACSDRVCLNCGKSPHILESQEQSSGLYDQINDIDLEYRSRVQRAINLRDDGDLEKSLAIWKELSQHSSNNQSIHNHIRELEAEIHNQSIEKLIGKGNNARRGRRYGRAVKAYHEAIRIISPRDPRKERLESILKSCKRDNQRTKMVYMIAGLALLVTGWVVIDPHIQYYLYEKEVRQARADIDNIAREGGGAKSYKKVLALAADLTSKGAEISERAQLNLVPLLNAAQDKALESLSQEALQHIVDALEEKDLAKTKKLITEFKVSFGPAHMSASINPLNKKLLSALEQKKVTEELLANAPKLFADAEEALKNKQLAQALIRFKALSESPDQSIKQKSLEHYQTLQKRHDKINKALSDSSNLINRDIAAAAKAIGSLKAESLLWSKQDEWSALSKQANDLLNQAKKDFVAAQRRKNKKELQSFIKKYPGTNEASQAADIIKDLDNEAAAVELALKKLNTLRAEKKWEQLHRNSRRFMRDFGSSHAEGIKIPLYIESFPQAANISVGDTVVGKTPFVYMYAPNESSSIQIKSDGFETKSYKLNDIKSNWKLSANLDRSIIKSISLRSPAVSIKAFNDSSLIVGKGAALLVDENGKSQSSQAISNLGMLGDNLQRWASYIYIDKDYCIIPNTAESILILDAGGEVAGRHTLEEEISSKPLIYINELFGADSRLAISNNGLSIATLDGTLKKVQDEHRIISGPVLADDGFEQLLVFISHTGQFIGFDESSSKIAWTEDSGAVNVGQMQSIGQGRFISTLDDSRLALFHLKLDGVKKVWEKPLPRSVIADPVIHGEFIFLALSDAVEVYNLKGIKQRSIEVPSGVTAMSAHSQSGIAIGSKDGYVTFMDLQAKTLWKRKLKSAASALLVVEKRVYIGTNTGQVLILAP